MQNLGINVKCRGLAERTQGKSGTWLTAVILLLFIAPTARGQACYIWDALLRGDEVVPPTGSPAQAFVVAQFLSCAECFIDPSDSLEVRVESLEDLEGTAITARIHHGVAGVNGPVICEFSLEGLTPPIGRRLVFNPADCVSLDMEEAYLVVTTSEYPEGEIRGQMILRPTPTRLTTWGSIRAAFEQSHRESQAPHVDPPQ